MKVLKNNILKVLIAFQHMNCVSSVGRGRKRKISFHGDQLSMSSVGNDTYRELSPSVFLCWVMCAGR